jgi:hypothetical protein
MSAFEEYQAAVRASDRFWCESDLYWRANRWEQDEAPGDVGKPSASEGIGEIGAVQN